MPRALSKRGLGMNSAVCVRAYDAEKEGMVNTHQPSVPLPPLLRVMPVDAIQWRVSVGMGNASRVCPTKPRCNVVEPTVEGLFHMLMVTMKTGIVSLLVLIDKGSPWHSKLHASTAP